MEITSPAAQFFAAMLTNLDDSVGDSVHAEMIDEAGTYPAVRFALFSGQKVLANGGGPLSGESLYLVSAHGREDITSPAALGLISAKFADALSTVDGAGPYQVGSYLVDCWEADRGDYRDSELIDGLRYDCIGSFFGVYIQPGSGGRALP